MTKNRSRLRLHTALLILGLAGIFLWFQLFRLVTNTAPTSANISLALLLLFLATTATGGLVSWAVHRRLERDVTLVVLLRQGTWIGVLLVLYAWLQLLEVLSIFVGGLLFALVVSAELLILLRGTHS